MNKMDLELFDDVYGSCLGEMVNEVMGLVFF